MILYIHHDIIYRPASLIQEAFGSECLGVVAPDTLEPAHAERIVPEVVMTLKELWS